MNVSSNHISTVIKVRAMVIINPGNPTGQCLSEANLKEILNFCYQNNVVLLGDEVYQQNIYQDERPFISARKVRVFQWYAVKICAKIALYIPKSEFSFVIIQHTKGSDGHGPTHEQGGRACLLPYRLQRLLWRMWATRWIL